MCWNLRDDERHFSHSVRIFRTLPRMWCQIIERLVDTDIPMEQQHPLQLFQLPQLLQLTQLLQLLLQLLQLQPLQPGQGCLLMLNLRRKRSGSVGRLIRPNEAVGKVCYSSSFAANPRTSRSWRWCRRLRHHPQRESWLHHPSLRLRHVSDAFSTCPGGQGVLKWVCGTLDLWTKLLRQSACDKSAEHISDNNTSDSPVRFLESCYTSQPYGGHYLRWDRSSRQLRRNFNEQVRAHLTLQQQLQMLCCGT